MAYFLDLFTPETWAAFRKQGATISGFRERQHATAKDRVKPGDILLCYLVRLSRWCGALEVKSPAFIDSAPIFSDPDPFIVRFEVNPLVLLDPDQSPPILDAEVWDALEETKGITKGSRGWGINFRGSLRPISPADGDFLLRLLQRQHDVQTAYPLSERDQGHLVAKRKVQTPTRQVVVEVPERGDDQDEPSEHESACLAPHIVAEPLGSDDAGVRQSIQIQAQIAEIGAKMGFHIWVPPSDRARVLSVVQAAHRGAFLAVLPLNYDENTLDTIRQIDVLWLKGRSMARAFEVEHTTAIYSGILRMADLLALQPNMQIRLHIVAPDERREKVLREIKRPVFSLLDHGPLYEKCTFLSYDAIQTISNERHLSHMSDTILDEYEERAEEGWAVAQRSRPRGSRGPGEHPRNAPQAEPAANRPASPDLAPSRDRLHRPIPEASARAGDAP